MGSPSNSQISAKPFPHLGVAYYGNRFISHATDDLKRIATCCDYVVHTVSETDLTYHKSVLSQIMKISHKEGLEIWADPWGLGGVFGGESFSKYLLNHRDSWQILSNKQVVPAACLNRPEWRSYVMEWILSVRDMGADVVFWDEPHVFFELDLEWGGVYSCTCEVCQQIFRKRFGAPMPAKLNDDARLFRKETLRGFLKEMMAFAKGKNLRNALCLYAFKGNEEYNQIWEEAAGLSDLDIFGCDPYWRWRGKNEAGPYVRDFSKIVQASASKNKKDSQIWIQAMRLPSGKEEEIAAAIQAACDEGITHIASWSFDGGELLDPVLSERPAVVWDVVLKKLIYRFEKAMDVNELREAQQFVHLLNPNPSHRKDVQNFFKLYPYLETIAVTPIDHPTHLETIVEWAILNKKRKLAVWGGDGTLSRVVQSLHFFNALSDVTVVVVPCGTGNDFARKLKIPEFSLKAEGYFSKEARDLMMDVGLVSYGSTSRTFINNSGFGRSLQSLSTYHPHPVRDIFELSPKRLRAEWRSNGIHQFETYQAVLGIIFNAPFFNKGLHFEETYDPSDGVLNMVLVSPSSKLGILCRFIRGRFGHSLLTAADVKLEAQFFQIESDQGLFPQVDGEVICLEPQRLLKFSLLKEKLRVRVP